MPDPLNFKILKEENDLYVFYDGPLIFMCFVCVCVFLQCFTLWKACIMPFFTTKYAMKKTIFYRISLS